MLSEGRLCELQQGRDWHCLSRVDGVVSYSLSLSWGGVDRLCLVVFLLGSYLSFLY